MQTLHILPALRNKLQDSDGTFNLRKERMKERKKKKLISFIACLII